MKNKIEALASDVRAALKEVGEKHNVDLKAGTFRYGDKDVSCRITGLDLDATGGASEEEVNYKERHSYYGLPEDGLGKTFDHMGKTFTVTGLKPSRRKYPVSAKGADGKGYKFPADLVKRLIG